MKTEFLNAIRNNDENKVKQLLDNNLSPNFREDITTLTPLMIAAGQSNSTIVELLLDAGADLFAVEALAGASVLHKACQGGNLEVVKMLVNAGSLIDLQTSSTGHTPLIEAMWYKWPDIVEYLLSKNAGININTHYGFTLQEHLDYALNVNVYGKERLIKIKNLIAAHIEKNEQQQKTEKLLNSVINNDINGVKQSINDNEDLEQRFPVVNGFNDAHTPLLIASRQGFADIVNELVNAGADVNAIEPTFGAVPLHKATYNGHANIVDILIKADNINLDYQGPTNGYTPLLDAIWHGYKDCAIKLINAGASLNIKGHDGKSALDIAIEVFGPEDEFVNLVKSTR